MTREWPTREQVPSHATSHASPHNAPIILLLAILAVVTVTALVPGSLDALLPVVGSLDALRAVIGNPLEFLVLVVVTTLFISAVADRITDLRDDASSTPPERALLRGLRAVALGDDPQTVARRLRGIDLRGRPRLCRDVAARCLERAGGCRRLDRRLRREARRWLREAVDEVHREMK